MTSLSKTPRPVPIIRDELTFSRKKRPSSIAREFHLAPRSPMKSAPPISRIFRHRAGSTPGAHAVSFRQSQTKAENNIQSPLYKTYDRLYFDQCFTKLSQVGAGSFGQVWKVQSKEDGKLYAIKKSRERFRSDFDRKQRLQEVNKSEYIPKHPNCVHFYKAWEELDHLYIQSELCEMSLKDYAESVQGIEEKEIWNIIVDLCHGLKNLHDVGFAHMDIKPANLFLGRDGLYKIGDFGLVVELKRDLSDAMDGDSTYLAPEIMEGKFSKAADVFSLGITILELACNLELPNNGLLWQQLRNNKLPLEFTEGLSDDLILLITQMMDPDPQKRPEIGEIKTMSSVLRAEAARLNVSFINKMLKPFIYLITLFFMAVSCILSFFHYEPNKTLQKRSVFAPPTVPESLLSIHSVDNTNIGHESLMNESAHQIAHMSPVVTNKSPFQQPVSNKRETALWKVSSPLNGNTPKHLCSSPTDCSPPSTIVSDRIVRSRLFTCSSDDEDVFKETKITKKLNNMFNNDLD